MIIIEGPDGAGKTTLIRQLSEDLEMPIAPRACTSEGGPVQELAKWVAMNLTEHALENRKDTLNDRYPLISEPIYGPLIRGRMAVAFDSQWYIDAWRAFLDLNPLIIFCLPNVETVVENVKKDATPQMDGVTFNIRSIYWLYYNLLSRLRAGSPEVGTILWNYEVNPEIQYIELLGIVEEFVRL